MQCGNDIEKDISAKNGSLDRFLFDLLTTFDPSMPVNNVTIFVHSELDRAQVKDKLIWLRSKKGD